MKNNNKDIFEGISIKNNQDTNFFLMEKLPQEKKYAKVSSEPAKRLNDYDFNILKEDAYKDISDDLFKLEYKISKTEEEIKDFETQILSAKEIGDYNLIEDLTTRKNILSEDLEALIAIYNEKSLSAKITDKFINFLGKTFKTDLKNLNQNYKLLSEKILSKLPKQFSSIIELKRSLNKLENLNKSVDELISMNIPYGENYNKYEQLSKYIIKANSIQAEISHYIKNN